MTEEEKLTLVMIVDKLDALNMMLFACTGQILAAVRPMAEEKAEAMSVADEAINEYEKHDRKFQDCADRLNELWGAECSE